MKHLGGFRLIFGFRNYRSYPCAQVVHCLALLTCSTRGLAAQSVTPKVDSIRIVLPVPREQAVSKAFDAMRAAGLNVVSTTPLLVFADEGATENFATGGSNHRIVRADVTPGDSSSAILITGQETRQWKSGQALFTNYGQTQQVGLRIDNRAEGNGGRVWKKMVRAALILDSLQVPIAAIPMDVAVPMRGEVAQEFQASFPWVGSTKTKTYFSRDCAGKKSIRSDDEIVFASEAQAADLGYKRGDC